MQVAPNVAAGNFTLPVALHGLQKWVAVVGTMCKTSNEDSDACLHKYFNHTFSMLDSLVSSAEGSLSPVILKPL